jgi:hypothetical protein
MVILSGVSEQRICITEDGTDTLCRNVGKGLHWTLRNNPGERRSHQHSGVSLKSRMVNFCPHTNKMTDSVA